MQAGQTKTATARQGGGGGGGDGDGTSEESSSGKRGLRRRRPEGCVKAVLSGVFLLFSTRVIVGHFLEIYLLYNV